MHGQQLVRAFAEVKAHGAGESAAAAAAVERVGSGELNDGTASGLYESACVGVLI